MRLNSVRLATVALILATTCSAWAAVNVQLQRPQIRETEESREVTQVATLSNVVAGYELSYHAFHSLDGTQVLSDSWAWTQGYVPLGMTAPSKENWYYQGFFNWQFDDESLHLTPATARIVRESGPDGMIEYTWETANASVSIRFAMAQGSDKLLMFGSYEPKTPIERSFIKLSCYPSFFPEPRERAVTTALGTRRPGETITLDPEQERWVLYEDTSEGRPGSGPAGMIVGTPDAFSSVEIPVGAYGTVTTLELKPEAREFAIALYDFPTTPDYRQVREYFSRMGDLEAEALERIAQGDLDQPITGMPYDEARLEQVLAAGRELLDRPAEIWRPAAEPLEFPWASNLPGDPLDTVLFCRRWEAWETMELARRLEMDVSHLYWDTEDALSNSRSWPYAAATGIGAIPPGVAATQAAVLAERPDSDLFIIAGLRASGVPGVARAAIAQQVADGKGLLLVGPADWQAEWTREMELEPAPDLVAQITSGFDVTGLAGLGPQGPGVSGDTVQAWRFGEGRVVLISINLGGFSSLMPRHYLSEDVLEAMDRWLGLYARAATVAAGRDQPATLAFGDLTPGGLPATIDGAPAGASLQVRVRDELGRNIALREVALPLQGGVIPLPSLPSSRTCWADVMVVNAQGETVGTGSAYLGSPGGPRIANVRINGASQTHELAPPLVDLPEGGSITCVATVDSPRRLDGAEVVWEVRDTFGRLLATAGTPAPAGGGEVTANLDLARPVTVCHQVDATLRQADETLDFQRLHFTMTVPYPYDDFTALMWTTTGGSPLLQITDRLCYEWGTEMCDPANTLRADDLRAAREYALTARSGMRLVPYATRIFSETNQDGVRVPSLSDPEYLREWQEWLTIQGRQAAPYQPAAYTLGDENYLYRGPGEIGRHPAAMAEFRAWLSQRYPDIAALNNAWETDYASFDAIEPMVLEEAVARVEDGEASSLAPWIEHKVFLDESFANTHNYFRDIIRAQDPDAKVGWDGILTYGWQSGYNFVDLTEQCDLNQTYISRWLQGRLMTDFKRPDALTGSWGNRVADVEAGWNAFPWACLMRGDNSTWWWTSWGVDYVPFNPDLSQSKFGEWFFRAVAETAGPGKMIVHAERETSPIAVLYSKRNMFAGTAAAAMTQSQPWAGDTAFRLEHEAMVQALFDLGYHPRHISEAQLAAGISPDDFRVLALPMATCLSEAEATAIRDYVAAGGTLIVDGRAGILTAEGAMHPERPLDEVLGVNAPAGPEAFAAASTTGEVAVEGTIPCAGGEMPLTLAAFGVRVLEPGLQATTGVALASAGEAPVLIANRLGDGVAITLNFMLQDYAAVRATDQPKPRLEILDAIVRGAGVQPLSEIALRDGGLPLATHQFAFSDGGARYLCVQQDILVPGLADQPARITLPEAAYVYDVRAGRQVGVGRVQEWDATLSRGEPLIYALLPYEVTGVTLQAPDAVERGAAAEVTAAVQGSANIRGYHAVRVDVFAPGSDAPHRQYSQTVDCDGGQGGITIPFALNDPAGAWRLVARDAASGATAEATLQVR